MASRTLNLQETLNHRVVTIFGSFLPQGSSAPLPNPIWAGSPTLGQWGQGVASVAFISTGLWTVVLTDAWYRLIGSGGAEVRMADNYPTGTANPNTAAIQSVNVTGATVNSIPAKTFQITNTASGSLANIASGTNQLIYFNLIVQNTNVQ
jgi:hypothetical protein